MKGQIIKSLLFLIIFVMRIVYDLYLFIYREKEREKLRKMELKLNSNHLWNSSH